MKVLKQRFVSLGLALALLLSVTGCAVKTPATVGTIGGVDIPAGIYLLNQYNAYNTVSGYCTYSTGESAKNVGYTLKADCTGKLGDVETTETGKQFVADLTLQSIEKYAAVESKFAELNGTLEDAATSEAASSADSDWTNYEDLYTANGISKDTVSAYYLNQQKAKAIPDLLYGDNGTQPITEQEYTDYVSNDCTYLAGIELPLMDTSTYSFASSEQATAIENLGKDCADQLSQVSTGETSITDLYSYLYSAASAYVPQAFQELGSNSYDASKLYYYMVAQLFTPTTLESFAQQSYVNTSTLTDALDAVDNGEWSSVTLGTTVLVFCKLNTLDSFSISELKQQYDLASAMKGDEVTAMLAELGTSMEHNLSTGAMNTYKAANIKKST
jgi:hypothetical protein